MVEESSGASVPTTMDEVNVLWAVLIVLGQAVHKDLNLMMEGRLGEIQKFLVVKLLVDLLKCYRSGSKRTITGSCCEVQLFMNTKNSLGNWLSVCFSALHVLFQCVECNCAQFGAFSPSDVIG